MSPLVSNREKLINDTRQWDSHFVHAGTLLGPGRSERPMEGIFKPQQLAGGLTRMGLNVSRDLLEKIPGRAVNELFRRGSSNGIGYLRFPGGETTSAVSAG